jgi:hypothetical protein
MTMLQVKLPGGATKSVVAVYRHKPLACGPPNCYDSVEVNLVLFESWTRNVTTLRRGFSHMGA